MGDAAFEVARHPPRSRSRAISTTSSRSTATSRPRCRRNRSSRVLPVQTESTPMARKPRRISRRTRPPRLATTDSVTGYAVPRIFVDFRERIGLQVIGLAITQPFWVQCEGRRRAAAGADAGIRAARPHLQRRQPGPLQGRVRQRRAALLSLAVRGFLTPDPSRREGEQASEVPRCEGKVTAMNGESPFPLGRGSVSVRPSAGRRATRSQGSGASWVPNQPRSKRWMRRPLARVCSAACGVAHHRQGEAERIERVPAIPEGGGHRDRAERIARRVKDLRRLRYRVE